MALPDGPGPSRLLMQLTWVAGAIGFWLGFDAWQDGNITAATNTVTLWVVGIVGVISFLRHAVFHRSDAKRMGWDYGKRNDFQLEVGFANLAWGLCGLIAWAQNWTLQAKGALLLVFGIYMALAAALHLSEPGRAASKVTTAVFAGCLLFFGSLALLQ